MRVLATLATLATTLVLLAAAAGPASAESLPGIFKAANDAYFQGDFGQATRGYQALVDAGVEDADVYFNLATAYGRMGKLGHAILYFERALWLRPGDDAIGAGLSATRRLLGKERAEREGEATVRTRPPVTEALAAPFSADGLAWLLLVLNALLFGALLVRARMPTETTRLAVTVAIPLVALVLLVVAGLLAVKLDAFDAGEPAIVLSDDAAIREGPDERASIRTRVRQGARARILRADSDYLEVRLAGGAAGWMNSKDLGQIRPN